MESGKELLSKKEKNEYRFKTYSLKLYLPRNNQPKGRSGHRIVSNNSYLYSFGGYNPTDEGESRDGVTVDDGKLFREFWKFNIATRQWQKLVHYKDALPKELASNAVALQGDTLIVHGGTGFPFGYSSSNKTYVTKLKGNSTFTLLETKGQKPVAQYGQAMALHDNKLYVVGGTSGFAYSLDIHCLDLRTKTWDATYTGKSHLDPQGRYRHEVALYNSKIIVFGGGTVQDAFDFQSLPAFNLKTNEWETLVTIPDPNREKCDSGYPAPRRCHGSVQIKEDELQDPEFVICGGYDGKKIFPDIWKINLKTLQWCNCKSKLPNPLYFHASSLSPNGQMFLFGGICKIYNDGNTLPTFRTNELLFTWVRIPKLSEMCWDALLYYNPNIIQFPKSKLLQSGIPAHFVDRIE